MSPSVSKRKSIQFLNAAKDGNLRLVKALSLHPAVDLNWQGPNDFTPFCCACSNGHLEIVRFLLDFKQRRIDDNLGHEGNGHSPMFIACLQGHERAVEMLLGEETVDANKGENRFGETPLWIASCLGRLRIVKLMLASGKWIDTLKRDKKRRTPAGIAKRKGHGGIVSLLESFERDPQVREQLRKDLGYSSGLAGELFALVIYLSDGYLQVPKLPPSPNSHHKARRFFSLAARLPMDLQMLLCNRVFGSEASIIKRAHSERGFRKFAN